MQPYYELDQSTSRIITELVDKCIELDLGNVNFSYYDDQVDFYMVEYKNYWQLVVSQKQGHYRTRDLYKIVDKQIIYQDSERD